MFSRDNAREKICRGASPFRRERAGDTCRRGHACTGRGCRSGPAREPCKRVPARSREFWRTGCGLRNGKANTREDLQTSAARVSRGFPRGAVLRLSGTSARSWASRTFLVYITHQWRSPAAAGLRGLDLAGTNPHVLKPALLAGAPGLLSACGLAYKELFVPRAP